MEAHGLLLIPRACRFTLLAVDSILEGFSGFKYRRLGRGDLDRFLCLGVAARAGFAALDLERAEADDLYFAIFGKLFGDGVKCCVDYLVTLVAGVRRPSLVT